MLAARGGIARLALDREVVVDQVGQVALLGQHGEEGGDELVIVVRAPTVIDLNMDN